MTYVLPDQAIKDALRQAAIFGSLRYYNDEEGYDKKVESILENLASENYTEGTVEFTKSQLTDLILTTFHDVMYIEHELDTIYNFLGIN